MMVERLLPFEAVFNFRDLGGYETADGRTVRWRRVFRADGLNRLREADAAEFGVLGIVTVIDLRTPEEADNAGRFPAHLGRATYHHLPMFDVMPDWHAAGDPEAEGYLADRYLEMLDSGRDAVAQTLELIADGAALPLVFHCAAGKDRTGIVAAIVLSLVGVADDTIASDYALSGEATERLIAWYRAQPETEIPRPATPMPSSVIASVPATMARFLGRVRSRYGSVEGLVTELGLPADVPERIRSNLLV